MTQSAQEAALVLSGGGAYGAFEVGIMKALFAGRSPATRYRPLEAKIFTGTSVGAFHVADSVEPVVKVPSAVFTVPSTLVAVRL